MINTVNTNTNSNVVVVTAPGPSGPIGPQGPTGSAGTIQTNSGTIVSPFLNVNGSTIITGSLIVSGSNTFINIGPAQFTGSTNILGNLIVNGTSSATLFSGSGAGLFGIPAAGITGLNLSRVATGSISASVLIGGNSFVLNNGGTNLFIVSNNGLGTFSNGLIINGSTGTFNQGLNVNNVSANLNAGVAIQGIATLNGNNILTTATVSTNRITDSNISASVSSTGKAFSVNNEATVLASIDQQGAISGSGVNISGSNTLINSPNIALVGAATLNGQPITTAGDLTLNQIKSGAVTASVSTGADSFILENSGTTLFRVSNTGILSGSGANLFNIPATGITGLNLSRIATGSVSASVNVGTTSFEIVSGSSTLAAVSSSGYVTASGYLGDGSRLSGVAIPYTNTGDRITSIEVADFDTNVAVTFVGGALKFVFGTPVPTAISSFTLSGFATDRFNSQNDNYDVIGNWVNNGYTLISASIYTGSVTLATIGAGSSLSTNLTTSGSQSYRLAITSSNPLDSSTVIITTTVNGTLSKSRPNVPTISITGNTVQLGISSNQIEEGGTGDISFSAAYGSANAWEEVSLTTSPTTSPQNVLATGTSTISATSNYQSPSGANNPQIFDNRTTTNTYTRIRSLRYGADTAASFTEADLQNLALWDTGLGGTIGVIAKGTTNPSGQSVTITWTGDKYHYIVYDSARANLTNITTGGFGVLSAFSVTTVGNYKVYRTNTLQAGGAGTSITYVLT
jgi:hypothetical protein